MQESNTSIYENFIGRVCIVLLSNGKKFSAKLTGAQNGALLFENKRGIQFIDRAEEVIELAVCQQREVVT